MTEFLTYELLTPEDANPVIIRITSQRERGFEDFRASNGVRLASQGSPRYYELENALYARGACEHMDDRRIEIPRADWPLVKVAIAELNEAKKEKGDMKEDRYEFPLDEWMFAVKEEGPKSHILYRKKPKVKVEWGNCSRCRKTYKTTSPHDASTQDVRALRKRLQDALKTIYMLDKRVEELEIELAGKQGRYEGLTERFLNLYLQLKDGLNYSGTFRDRWIKQLEPYFEEAPMANELVKEIEEAEGVLNGELAETYVDGTAQIVLHCVEAERIQSTLQRAREALTWKPFPENFPKYSGEYIVQQEIQGRAPIVRLSNYWANSHRTKNSGPVAGSWGCTGVTAFMEKPTPYTPEEK